jgi:hypothetical protein
MWHLSSRTFSHSFVGTPRVQAYKIPGAFGSVPPLLSSDIFLQAWRRSGHPLQKQIRLAAYPSIYTHPIPADCRSWVSLCRIAFLPWEAGKGIDKLHDLTLPWNK